MAQIVPLVPLLSNSCFGWIQFISRARKMVGAGAKRSADQSWHIDCGKLPGKPPMGD